MNISMNINYSWWSIVSKETKTPSGQIYFKSKVPEMLLECIKQFETRPDYRIKVIR